MDFVAPEFLHALGIAVATFANVEAVLMAAFFRARHQSQDYASYPDSAKEIYEANFSKKINKAFKEFRSKFKNPYSEGVADLQTEFHDARIARNFIVHGVWLQGQDAGSYRCSMIDIGGRRVLNEVSRDVILGEANRAEHLMIQLKSLLIAEGLYPAVGPETPPA